MWMVNAEDSSFLVAEDDCSLGNHQSPIRIDSDSLKDGLTGQNISFNLVQVLDF